MPLPHTFPIVLRGAPLTPPPPTGPHRPSVAIQARLSAELLAAIADARNKGLPLHFEPSGPAAGFHVGGKHFPLRQVTYERTPHEVYACRAAPKPELQVIGKVAANCDVQRTLTEEEQAKFLQSRYAEGTSTRTIARLDAPSVTAKAPVVTRKPVKKKVLDANTVEAAIRASPAPGAAGNSPPPATLDGPPNAFQTLLIHHLAHTPSTLQRLATTLKRQPKDIRGSLDLVATNDESSTGPRSDNPVWTLKPSAYQYLRLTPNASTGGPWLTLSPEDIKRIVADANRAFDQLGLPPDAQARKALAAQQPAPPPPKPQESAASGAPSPVPLKHPLPARPATGATPNGRLDVPRPSRVPSPADVGASPRDTPAQRAPPRVSGAVKDKAKPTVGDVEPKKNGTGAKTKTSANGKDKSKPKSKPILADSDGEDFVKTKRDRERKPPPPTTASTSSRSSAVPPTILASSSSSRSVAEPKSKKSKRDVADAAFALEREVEVYDSASSSRPTAVGQALSAESKKRRTTEQDQVRKRKKDADPGRAKEGATEIVRDPERKTKAAALEAKRKRDAEDSDTPLDTRRLEKKKRRADGIASGTSTPVPIKRERLAQERDTGSNTESRKIRSGREASATTRVREVIRPSTTGKKNGVSVSLIPSTSAKTNGSNKRERASVTYTSSEDEGASPVPVQRRPPANNSAPAAGRPSKPSASEASTPRDHDRDDRAHRKAASDVVLPSKRPSLPSNASAEDVRDRYTEVYADYMSLNARLATERVRVQRLLKDMEEGDHDAILDWTTVNTLTKAYQDAHEELAALKVRLGPARD